jgi:hypothetical protein
MRRLIALLAVLVVLVICGYWLTRPSINRVNYARVDSGMTLDQVRELMGAAGKELPANAISQEVKDGRLVDLLTGDRKFQWVDGSTDIRIGFENGRVVSKVIGDGWNSAWP